jgi:uncharacterized membrane protein YfcA
MEPEADQAIGSARRRSVGSDLAQAVPLTLVAGLGHWLIGTVDWYIVGALLLGSLPGIKRSAPMSHRLRVLPFAVGGTV